MLYLCFVAFTFMASITQAAVTVKQSQISVTKPGDGQSTVDITCRILADEYFTIHWYVQKRNGELKRILYVRKKADPVYDTGATRDKFLTEWNSDKLTIKKLADEDAGIYYCAHWDYNRWKIFGEGTQLIISNQPVKEPEVAILKSSIEDVIRQGFAIYMCSLQNFFPGVIRVVWNEYDSGKEVVSEQDVVEHNTDSNTYSLNSWIKVMNSDLGKMFTCKYKHEKNGDGWKNTFVSGYEYLKYQPVMEPEVTIFKSSKIEVAREGFAIYTCSLQNFSPEAIRVVWNEGDREQEVKSQQGEIKHNPDNKTYSLNSSIKVPKDDLRKTFTCKYNQRATMEGWKYISVSGNEYIQEIQRSNYTHLYSEGTPHLNHMIYRAAQMTYAVLLLKGVLYCPLLIFLKSKVKP